MYKTSRTVDQTNMLLYVSPAIKSDKSDCKQVFNLPNRFSVVCAYLPCKDLVKM